ncbi:carboxylesterase family protein [Streptomyces sp. NPDC003032]
MDSSAGPQGAVAPGRGNRTVFEEANLYLAPVDAYATSTSADVDAVATRAHPDPVRLVDTYRGSRPRAAFGELRSAIMGEAPLGAGSRAPADAHADRSRAATYRYESAWCSHALDGEMGAAHAMELTFVCDLTRLPRLHGAHALLGPDRPPAGLAPPRVHETWTRFAAPGDPGWHPYGPERRATMRVDTDWTRIDDPRGQERQAWT